MRGTGEALVVDATITSELIPQVVILREAVSLDESEPTFVSGASVWIEDSSGSRYDFQENEAGRYVSDQAFAVESGRLYTLHIITDDKEYVSTAEQVPTPTQIDEIFGQYVNTPSSETDGIEEGIQFFVNASPTDPSSDVFNLRLEYEEDYIITVPYASPYVYSVETGIQPREFSIQTCYSNTTSTDLVIGSTSGQTQNIIQDLPVHFVSPEDPDLRLRYALLVKQYSITPAAYRYYQDLKENNESGGGFADRQKGSIIGNIVNTNDAEEIVLGYFEVAHYTEQRAFFEPTIWSEEGFLPDAFFRSCEYSIAADTVLTDDLQNDLVNLGTRNIHAMSTSGEFTILVPEACSDCRLYGNLEQPAFWE